MLNSVPSRLFVRGNLNMVMLDKVILDSGLGCHKILIAHGPSKKTKFPGKHCCALGSDFIINNIQDITEGDD